MISKTQATPALGCGLISVSPGVSFARLCYRSGILEYVSRDYDPMIRIRSNLSLKRYGMRACGSGINYPDFILTELACVPRIVDLRLGFYQSKGYPSL